MIVFRMWEYCFNEAALKVAGMPQYLAFIAFAFIWFRDLKACFKDGKFAAYLRLIAAFIGAGLVSYLPLIAALFGTGLDEYLPITAFTGAGLVAYLLLVVDFLGISGWLHAYASLQP